MPSCTYGALPLLSVGKRKADASPRPTLTRMVLPPALVASAGVASAALPPPMRWNTSAWAPTVAGIAPSERPSAAPSPSLPPQPASKQAIAPARTGATSPA